MIRVWHGKTSRLAAGFATVVLLFGGHAASAAFIDKVPPPSGGSGGPVVNAIGNIVVNGGFETGNFSGWTVNSPTDFILVDGNPHSGTFAALLGPLGPPGTLSQTLATVAGTPYTLSFFLESDGGLPNSFSASVGGATVFSVVNFGATPYIGYSFNFTAASSSTLLQFAAVNVPGFFYLDDVSVVGQIVPEPSSCVLLGLGLAGLMSRAIRRRA